jgi:hypothetical protein
MNVLLCTLTKSFDSFRGAIRELKRLEAETKTPIFTIVQEVSSGLDSIRAYGKEKQLLNK